MKRTLRRLGPTDLGGRRVLVRVDYNVPLESGEVRDDARIGATLPTLRHLLDAGGRPVLMSHLGRPGGSPDPELSLAPVAVRLEALLERPVRFAGPADSEEALRESRGLETGSLLLLENLRFLPGEKKNDPELARRLARLGDLYVNDAFGACHRKHCSVVGVPAVLHPAVAGLLVEAELGALDRLRSEPDRPFIVIMGGAKIGDKIELMEAFLGRADRILVGGAMANTFLKASGREIGFSLVEDEALVEARRLATKGGDRVELPIDLVVAASPDDGDRAHVVDPDSIPSDAMALDIGPDTRDAYAMALAGAATVFWNGPMGLFENSAFAAGTRAVARAVAEACDAGAFAVVGGGDSARAVREAGLADRLSHVSTGGGAALEYLATGSLPGVEALDDAP
ncbi:MAG: phosphoglycerate kinase [Candidatus Palauibacterales bacterium]|nr:phosphoglycerate kinase [Candidatus Palauibacterales bacterium]MDP2583278.1 phosphoglycerate kinase [Candidatus Palauibacterales bacterium]